MSGSLARQTHGIAGERWAPSLAIGAWTYSITSWDSRNLSSRRSITHSEKEEASRARAPPVLSRYALRKRGVGVGVCG